MTKNVMKVLLFALLIPFSILYATADPGKIVTFYIDDYNLVIHHKDIEVLSTAGLVDFAINGVPIDGPSTMTETGIDTGTFQIQIELPDTVNGKPLQDGNVLVMTYHQRVDNSGNPSTQTQSYVISVAPSSNISSSTQNVGIGEEFTLQIDDPNFNLDSTKPDIIPLNLVEFRSNGLDVTLADPAFNIPTFGLRETGPNTNIFAATFKIPRQIDGVPIELGSTAEFDFTDPTTGSLSQQVIATITIGHANYNVSPPSRSPLEIYTQIANSSGTIVIYQKNATDSVDGVADPFCIPPSGSLFPVGHTAVSCSGKDDTGNSVVRTFTIHVSYAPHLIPSWFKNVANFWCNGEIDDKTFTHSIQHLIAKKIIASTQSNLINSQILPSQSVCQWKNNMISDLEFLKDLGL